MFKIEDLKEGKSIQEFITSNSFKLQDPKVVADRIKSSETIFGWDVEVLFLCAEYEDIKDLLKPEALEKYESGKDKWVIGTIEEVSKSFAGYMEFAWGKALDERGISAGRSIEKLSIWMWLLSREDLASLLNNDDLYNPYGAPALIECCKRLSIEVPDKLIEFANRKC